MLAAVLVLGIATFLLKGAGALLTHVPESVVRRLPGLAPALLAALVVSELSRGGTPRLDQKAAGVAAAVLLAAVRAPLAACVIAGAAVAAALRAIS